jgi:hypothetical protein
VTIDGAASLSIPITATAAVWCCCGGVYCNSNNSNNNNTYVIS